VNKIQLKRIDPQNGYTGGELYINGAYFCDVLEDEARPDGVKIYGETCIPAGVYKAEVTYSNKFKRNLILIKDVPGFTGIRIHAGNRAKDTLGCPLVGVRVKDALKYGSRAFEDVLTHACSKWGEFIIEITY
jgi:hypothetical protein